MKDNNMKNITRDILCVASCVGVEVICEASKHAVDSDRGMNRETKKAVMLGIDVAGDGVKCLINKAFAQDTQDDPKERQPDVQDASTTPYQNLGSSASDEDVAPLCDLEEGDDRGGAGAKG